MGVAEAVIGDAGDQGDFLADGNGGRLVVAGEDGRTGQNLGLAGSGQRVQGHLVVLAQNLVEARAPPSARGWLEVLVPLNIVDENSGAITEGMMEAPV